MGCGRSKPVDNSGNKIVDNSGNKIVDKILPKTPGITFDENGSNIIARYDIVEQVEGWGSLLPLGMNTTVTDTTNGDIVMTTGTSDSEPLTRATIEDEGDKIKKIIMNTPPVINHTYKLSIKVSVQYQHQKNGVTYNPVEIYSITRTYGDNRNSIITENRLEDSPEYSKMLKESSTVEGFISKSKYLPLDYAPYNK
jgi:hypothetical protein